MSGIGKHNYIDKFIEFHEGLLGPDQARELEVFLLEYPEFRDEFEALGDAYLQSSELSGFPNKESLKKREDEFQAADEDSLRLVPTLQTMPGSEALKMSTENSLPAFLEAKLTELNQSYALKPDLGIRLKDPSALKKEDRKVFALYPNVKRFIAVAASLLLVWMLWPVEDPIGKAFQLRADHPIELTREGSTKSTPVSNIQTPSLSPQVQKPNRVQSPQELAPERPQIAFAKLPSLGVPSLRLADFRNDRIPAMRPLPVVDQVPHPLYAQQPIQGREMPQYISLTEYARIQLNQSLVNEANPKEGLLLALLDKSVDKLADKTDIDMDIDVQKEKGKRIEHFRFTLGRLEIIK